ncbi:MAG TPA: hypothetical protein VGN57_21210 [Pirellulaceae bacterium]|jgi:hypothetical protein|nr:hypothetical protein [Pirellulaceae bacterium]
MAASRENVWLQAALIIFVLISVVLGATTWVYYTSARRADEAAMSKETQLQNERKRAEGNAAAFNLVAHYVGNAPKTEAEVQSYESMVATNGSPELQTQVKAIGDAYKGDMQNFAMEFPAENRNYHVLPQHLMDIIRDLNARVAEAREQVRLKDAELTQVKQTEGVKTSEAEKGREAAIADRNTIKEQATQEKTRVDAERDALAKEKDAMRAQIAKMGQEFQTEKNQLQAQIQEFTTSIATLQETLATYEHGLTSPADGRITQIDQRNNRGYVNLGEADGLKPATTFSVYNQEETRFGEVTPKGKVEITRITGPHQAEFRILESDTFQPIQRSDVIQSPVWNAGDQVRFALAGILDIDGDGDSDLDQVRNIIRSNNGAIDAEMTEQGDYTGTMTVKTRYLVVGERPTETSPQAFRDTFSRMVSDADQYSIERIDLQKLLEYMGYRAQATITPLGAGGGSARGQGGDGDSAFRPRTVPIRN